MLHTENELLTWKLPINWPVRADSAFKEGAFKQGVLCRQQYANQNVLLNIKAYTGKPILVSPNIMNLEMCIKLVLYYIM